MSNLWAKDHSQNGNHFINLFATIANEEWAEEIWTKNPNNLFDYRSLKDNQYSMELRLNGNTKFRSGQWSTAMNLYNKSLRFAELNSENCALAYAKRSECFYEMQFYEKALNDIELAVRANISKRFHAKLNECKEKCQQKLLASCQSHVSHPSIRLCSDADEQYPCMANILELKQNEEFGRHLLARRDIAAGQTVLIETDFVSVKCVDDADADADGIESVCDTCFQSKMNFIACDQCPDAVFCSIDCLTNNSIHKWVCGTVFPELHYKIQFQIHAILLACNTFQNVEKLMEFIEYVRAEDTEKIPKSLLDAKSKYHFFLKLQKTKTFSPPACILQAKKIYEYLALLPKVNAHFNSIEKRRFLMHLILHHLLVIRCNGIISGDPWSVMSVFNVLSMLNHSCAPNLYHPRRGKQQYCVAIRPIQKGQQLFISYLSPNDWSTMDIRQQKLKYSWGFDCICERCYTQQQQQQQQQSIQNEPTMMTIQKIQTDPSYQFILANHGNTDKEYELFECCLKFLNKYGHLPWSMQIFAIIGTFMNLYVEMLLKCE